MGSGDRDLNRNVLQFLLKFATSADPRVQRLYAEFGPRLMGTALQHFHRWPAATRKHSSSLLVVFLERHGPQFHSTLLAIWQQPGTSGVHTTLSAEHREVCAQLFGQLAGPRFKAFLWDMAAIANGAQTADVLLSYQLAPRVKKK